MLREKVFTKRVGDSLRRFRVIADKRISIERCDLRRLRRARCLCFRIHDSLDRREHAFAHAFIERSHIQFNDRLVRNDILLRSCLE